MTAAEISQIAPQFAEALRAHLEPWWYRRKAFTRRDAKRYLLEVYTVPAEKFEAAYKAGEVARLPWNAPAGEPAFAKAELDRWAEVELGLALSLREVKP